MTKPVKPPHNAAPVFPEGWRVFPVKAGTKEPQFYGWAKEATDDPVQIEAWFLQYPDCNWGLACGPSGLAVIDIDPPLGEESLFAFELEHEQLPATREHGSARGGRHLIYRGDIKPTVSVLGPKLDTRGGNSYILIPPSTFEGKPYTVAQDGPLADLPQFVADAAGRGHERLPASDIPADRPGNIIRAIQYLGIDAPVAVDGSGGNSQTFEVAASLWDLGISEGKAVELMLEYYNPRCLGPWPDEDIIQIVHNAYIYPQNGFGCHAVASVRDRIPAEALDKLITESIAAATTLAAETKPDKRVIQIVGGKLPENVDEAEAALIEGDANLYQRGELLVRPGNVVVGVRGGKKAKDLLLVPVKQSEVIERMTDAAQFERWDARMKGWKKINCPKELAETYLSRIGRWKLRPLMGIINAPTLRDDGSILDKPGYDASSGLLYDPRGTTFPSIPLHPTKEDAAAALKCIEDELLSGFPFASPEAKAVMLAAILTSCVRRTLPLAPIFGFDATGAGSGKSLAADVVATIGYGRPASPITTGGKSEELDKRIEAILLRGDGALCIDNVIASLDSATLSAVLTAASYSCRILGQSKAPKTPTNCLFMATGNGLTFGGDNWRRGLICLIDPAMERPSERVFDFNPVERAKEKRGRYVAAALTIMRAYQVAGSPKQNGRVMGSFEAWTRTVRDPLLWLGKADPVATAIPPADDPERERFGGVLLAWRDIIGEGRAVTLKAAIQIAVEAATETPSRAALFDAFHAIAAPMVRGDEKLDTRRLGEWLRIKKRQVIHGLRFMPDGATDGAARWRLESVSKNGGKT